MRAARSFDLILITDPSLRDPVDLMRRALDGAEPGRVAVQLRAKQWTHEQRVDAALELREIARATNSTLLINTDSQLCLHSDSHGVQLPEAGPTIAETRQLIGVDRLIGASCHDRSALLRAYQQGADFALLSPWGVVPDKRDALGDVAFREIARGCRIPIYALGGIGLDQIDAAVGAGAVGVAVIRELHQSSDPARWVQRAMALLTRAHG